jgi:DNA-binding transcriptional ArsR family regulator
MNHRFAETASLLSDPGRAAIVMALMGDVALPAGQLAMVANVAPQTASSHLARLVAGKLLTVEQQGRHRYYRLANADVASAVEALLAITPQGNGNGSRLETHVPAAADGLTFARSCYSHLAGKLAVEIAEALVRRGWLVNGDSKQFAITRTGREWFKQIGLEFSEAEVRHARFARQCLDWTERRHHIGGQLGCAMLTRFRELKWIATVRDSRAVRLTHEGERQLAKRLGVRSLRG